MIRRLLALPLVALITISACQTSLAKDDFDFDRITMKDLMAARQRPTFPPASMPPADHLVVPPQENPYLPIRPDGQPFVLNQDVSVNLTDALNRYYFNPKWRGEEWGPFNTYWIPERAVLLMPTWQEYDQFSTLRIFNGWHKFWEKYSGYGP